MSGPVGFNRVGSFRFFAVPVKAKDTAAMPIRAFAEVDQ